MLEKRERFFIRHRLVLRPKRQQGAALPFLARDPELSAVSVLKAAVANKQAFFKLAGGDTVRITRVDVREADDIAILLFRRRNPKAATQVFEDAEHESIRAADRGPKDDPAVSAHVFVQLKPHAGGVVSHRAIMEEVPGLGTSYIRLVLDEVVKGRAYDYLDDRGQSKQTSTKVEFWGVPSANLKDAVKKNGFDFIELVKAPNLDGLDTEGLVARPERLRLYPQRGLKGDREKIVERVFGWARERGWSDVSVQVCENEKTKVVKIGREADAATTLFVRADLVKTTKDMPACSDEVNEELVAQARAMFADDASWQ